MKTNQNMIRKMGDFDVTQRTKDGMFNATALLKQWNEFSGMHKNVQDFERLSSTKEFIQTIENDLSIKMGDSLKPINQALIKTRAKTDKKGKKIAGAVWMHPYLFIDFAMWINPKFKLQVIKFVYDELIKHRHLAGDYYNKLCSSLARFKDVDFRELGKMLNYVVFNNHEKGMRNIATPEQEEELQQLERDMCQYIDMGFINSYNQFKAAMRKEWTKRHGKAPALLA